MSTENAGYFYSAHRRIERAEEHLKDLESKIDEFFGEKPHTHAVERDPNGTHEIHKICFTKRFPYRWRILATETIEHLRASLDHATFAAHLAAGGDPNARYVAFPFGKSATDLDNSIRGRSKDLMPEIQTFLRTLNCYEGGNDALYILNELSNLSKHALITFIAGAAIDLEIHATRRPDFVELFDPFIWDRAKNEIKYARVPIGADFQHNATFNLFVALQYKEVSSAVSATAALHVLSDETWEAVRGLEAECRRLGLIR
jgi:hypothetical protein